MSEPTESESVESESVESEIDSGDGRVLPFPMHRVEEPDAAAEPADTPLRDVLGDVLREERLRQERTLAEVADDAAVSLPYLSEIERGRKEVSSDVLDAIIRSLELDLAEVLERAADRLRIDCALTVSISSISPGRTRPDGRGPQIQLLAA